MYRAVTRQIEVTVAIIVAPSQRGHQLLVGDRRPDGLRRQRALVIAVDPALPADARGQVKVDLMEEGKYLLSLQNFW